MYVQAQKNSAKPAESQLNPHDKDASENMQLHAYYCHFKH